MAQPSFAVSIAGRPLSLATAHTSVLVGLEPSAIRIEVCSTRGPAFFQMVGLPEASVREARVRVASALAGLGVLLDEYALTVNLAPADLRKSGAGLDLAIALAVLVAMGKLEQGCLEGVLLLGELALDGQIQGVRGVLPQLSGACARGLSAAVVPAANAREAGLVKGLNVFAAPTLGAVYQHLAGTRPLSPVGHTRYQPSPVDSALDLAEVRGQTTARRALEVAAAGGHNLLFVGPPGCGKTLLARCLPGLLPALSFEEAIECTKVVVVGFRFLLARAGADA